MAIRFRIIKSKGREYAAIVENFRDPATGKSRTTCLKSYGSLSKLKAINPNIEEELREEARRLQESKEAGEAVVSSESLPVDLPPAIGAKASRCLALGAVIWRRAFEDLKLPQLLSRMKDKHRLNFDLDKALYALCSTLLSGQDDILEPGIFDYGDLSEVALAGALRVLGEERQELFKLMGKGRRRGKGRLPLMCFAFPDSLQLQAGSKDLMPPPCIIGLNPAQKELPESITADPLSGADLKSCLSALEHIIKKQNDPPPFVAALSMDLLEEAQLDQILGPFDPKQWSCSPILDAEGLPEEFYHESTLSAPAPILRSLCGEKPLRLVVSSSCKRRSRDIETYPFKHQRLAGYRAFISNLGKESADAHALCQGMDYAMKLKDSLQDLFKIIKPASQAQVQGAAALCCLSLFMKKLCLKKIRDQVDKSFDADDLKDFLSALTYAKLTGDPKREAVLMKVTVASAKTVALHDEIYRCFGIEEFNTMERASELKRKIGVSLPLSGFLGGRSDS